ncbi:MAG: cytochrome c [Myxococcales bacterium]|nr:cytochrome c [Myxococcales bacterium]
MRSRMLALGAGLLLATAGCVPKPKQAYSTDQIKQLESLEELMRVQAEAADPLFARIGQPAYTDAEYARLEQLGQKLAATSEAMASRFSQNRPPSFSTYAKRLGEQAGELLGAAQAKDAAKASTTLTGMRETCKTCHKEHR